MKRVFLVTVLLIMSIQARENPFFPSQGEEDLPYTSNEQEALKSLDRASITLPSTARIIKKVTIEYENLDASTKSIDLDNTVDWHLPVFISQSYANEKIEKEPSNNKLEKKSLKKKETFKSVAKMKYAEFLTSKNSLKILTKDKLIRNFLLAQPHRIVMDFEKDASLNSYIKKIPKSTFTRIRVGNHKGYYRIVIELDGYYRYKLEKQSNGCLITLE